MSNHLVIATVTAALSRIVQAAASEGVPGAIVHLGRPDTGNEEGDPKVGILLYQVTPNRAVRNSRQPIRSSDGRLLETPAVALDLHYLLSFYGDAAEYEPELMVAPVVRALEVTPILTRAAIEKTIQENQVLLGDSNLHLAPETVKATHVALNLEELSKIWSIFFQVPYALSLAYACSYVLVESETMGRPALPVTRPMIRPLPMSNVSLTSVEAVAGAHAPIVWGESIRIRGRSLSKHGLGLRVSGREATLDPKRVHPDEIVLALVEASFGGRELAAGIHSVQVLDPAPSNAPPQLARTTDLFPFALRPKLTLAADAVRIQPGGNPGAPVAGEIRVGFVPRIVSGQEVRLLLDERSDERPASHVLVAKPVGAGSFPAAELAFGFTGVKQGTYLVRALVDGVQSAPDVETDVHSAEYGQITGPEADFT